MRKILTKQSVKGENSECARYYITIYYNRKQRMCEIRTLQLITGENRECTGF